MQDVNWARAGLGLALLEEAVERKPGAVPVGQYISPPPTLAHHIKGIVSGDEYFLKVLKYETVLFE